MDLTPPEIKIEVREFADEALTPVVDLAEVRIARGAARNVCAIHMNVVYCTHTRTIQCKDCGAIVEGFDAFLTVALHFSRMAVAARAKMREAEAALRAVIIRRAAKAIDLAWGRKMAVRCPHCRRGLLPEDFVDPAEVSAEIERQRRKREEA